MSEVETKSAAQPPVMRSAVVARNLDDTFDIFTNEIGAWWPLPTHGIFGERSGGVRFVDGLLIEVAIDGTQSVWAQVLEWNKPDGVVLAWHPGGDAASASRVEFTFDAVEGGTRVEIRHHGWEAFGRDSMDRRRSYVGPSAWGHMLDHLADGAELRSDAPDVSKLESAYGEFFAVAELGGFGEPEAGHWNASEVVAHVALNDLAMAAVAQGLVHRDDPSFENHTCQVPDNLAAVIANAGDMSGLIAFGRECSRIAVAAARRLNADQQAQLVPCRIEHEGNVVMDEVRPWAAIAVTVQADMHLPAHIQQLQNLRS